MTLFKTVDFGPGYESLGTVGYVLYNPNGSVKQVRTTSGVVNISQATYGCNMTLDADWKGSIVWDTGGASPIYASDDFNYAEASLGVAGAVWDQPTSAHVGAGSFGEWVKNGLLSFAKFIGLK
jgi:hypothetical protein